MRIIDDNPESVLQQIKAAESRCNIAYNNWDQDAYEGAADSGNRYYARLVELVGAEKAKEMVQADDLSVL
jgi:hypothetical protein